MINAYREDLAHIHDVGFGGFAKQSAPGLLALLRRHGVTRGRVVDLGCGPGTWARTLAAAGHDVVGIDISRAMIAIARKRVPRGTFLVGSLHRLRLPRCQVVTAIGECLNYQFDAMRTKASLHSLLRRIHAALEPGGLLIFDVAEPGQLPKGQPALKHFAARDWDLIVRVTESQRARTLVREIITFRRVGRYHRRDTETHRLRLFARDDVLEPLRATGFEVTTTTRYGSFRLPHAHTAYVARKT